MCHKHTAARRLRVGALECSLDNPSGKKHLKNKLKYIYFNIILEIVILTPYRLRLTSFDFPLSVHIIMGLSATVHSTLKWLKKMIYMLIN